jgi:outer membrane receptor protein involved in Fe transport
VGGIRHYHYLYNSHSISDLSSRAGLVFDAGSSTFIKLLYGQSFRVPTFQEREVKSSSNVANPDLLPEKGTSFDLIFAKAFGNSLEGSVDFFLTEIRDQILKAPYNGSTKVNQAQNVGSPNYKGMEINLKYKVNSSISGFGGYSYTHAVNDNMLLPFTYFHMLNWGGSFKLSDKFVLNASSKYLSNWGPAGSYILFNSGLTYMPKGPREFAINFKIDNIFNKTVELPEISFASPNAPTIPSNNIGRQFYLTLSYNY